MENIPCKSCSGPTDRGGVPGSSVAMTALPFALYLLACLAIPPAWAWLCWGVIGRLAARRGRAAIAAARPPADYQL